METTQGEEEEEAFEHEEICLQQAAKQKISKCRCLRDLCTPSAPRTSWPVPSREKLLLRRKMGEATRDTVCPWFF